MIASDQESAKAYAALLRRVTGVRPAVVLSDEPKASRKIAQFSESDDPWMVAVRMVSEGVDIPRLAVGVYATATQTPLFFAQAVGRFVRVRRRGETASIFLPSVPALLSYAGELEKQRDHMLGRGSDGDEDDADALAAALAAAALTVSEPGFRALGSDATFDRVLYDGGEFGTQAHVGSAEEADYLGIPGLLEPDQVAALLRRRQAEQQAALRRRKEGRGDEGAEIGNEAPDAGQRSTHEQLSVLRRELNGLVGAWHHRTGRPHGAIHAELRQVTGGRPAALATAAELRARIDTIRTWARASWSKER